MTGALTPEPFSTILSGMSRARVAAVLVFIVSLVVAALIFFDAAPLLRGPAPDSTIWHWPYFLRPDVTLVARAAVRGFAGRRGDVVGGVSFLKAVARFGHLCSGPGLAVKHSLCGPT